MGSIRLFNLVVILATYSDAELQFHKLTHEWISMAYNMLGVE